MASILKTLLCDQLKTCNWAKKMQQLSGLFYSCLKFRQSGNLGKTAVFLLLSILLSSCGAKAPNKKVGRDFYEKQIQLLLIEKQCAVNQPTSALTSEINRLYFSYVKVNPAAFNFIPARLYDYKTPLKISPLMLKNSLEQIKAKMANSPENTGKIAEELFHLYQNTNRFDSVKCSFPALAQKKNLDIRPYMELSEFCQGKDTGPLCSDQTFHTASVEESAFFEKSALKLCQSFSKDISCQTELVIQKKQLKLPDMVKHYQQRFRQERFEKLFSLRDKHLAFRCSETDGQTQMNIKVHKGKWNENELKTMLDFVSGRWSKATFKLSFTIVNHVSSADETIIEILPSSGFISYVPDNNNRIVYLSDKLDFFTRQKILAHEMGHVLGFPDCYIEFFDEKEKELIYYEHSNTDTNIMCSVKNNVVAPDDYLKQLREKSCLTQ